MTAATVACSRGSFLSGLTLGLGVVCLLSFSGFACETAIGSESPGKGAVTIGVGGGAGTLDAMSISDLRPQSHGRTIGQLELGYQLGEHWATSVSGLFGGAWFDFEGPGTSGNIEDASWALRWFADRVVPIAPRRRVQFGMGFSYGEARSWVHNLTFRDEGPHTFMTGGVARAELVQSVGSRLQVFGAVDQSVYNAHAKDPPTGLRYNWLGRSFTAALGVRFAVVRGRTD